MPSESIDADIDKLHPEFIRELAKNYMELVRGLLGHEQEILSACACGDVERARRHAERSMRALQDAFGLLMTPKLQKDWYGSRGFLLTFAMIEDALRSARQGNRHWLTALASDEVTTSTKDVPRAHIEVHAAALLDVFGPKIGQQLVADEIARVLRKTGFVTKRGPPKGSTVREWLKAIRKQTAKSSSLATPSSFFQRRLEYFSRYRRDFLGGSFEAGLSHLDRSSRRLVPHLIGSIPPTS